MLPSKVHGHLAREDNIRVAPFTSHVREPNAKMFGHLLLNPLDSERLFGVFPQNIPQQLLHRFSGTLSLIQLLVRGNPRQGALQAPNIGADMLCEIGQHILAKLGLEGSGLFLENRHSSFDIRRMQFCG